MKKPGIIAMGASQMTAAPIRITAEVSFFNIFGPNDCGLAFYGSLPQVLAARPVGIETHADALGKFERGDRAEGDIFNTKDEDSN
jgi:hypothetical protein